MYVYDLSPEGFSHIVDPHEYCDQLLSNIYIYQITGPFILCGDFNSRCGNEADYIEGVDDITERSTVDYKKKSLWRYPSRLLNN